MAKKKELPDAGEFHGELFMLDEFVKNDGTRKWIDFVNEYGGEACKIYLNLLHSKMIEVGDHFLTKKITPRGQELYHQFLRGEIDSAQFAREFEHEKPCEACGGTGHLTFEYWIKKTEAYGGNRKKWDKMSGGLNEIEYLLCEVCGGSGKNK